MKKVYCIFCKHMTMDNPVLPFLAVVGCKLVPIKKWFSTRSFFDYRGASWYGSAKKKNRDNLCRDFSIGDYYTQEFVDKNTNNGE